MINKFHSLAIFCLSSLLLSCSETTGDKSTQPETTINTSFLEKVKTTKSVLSNQKEELTLTGKVEYDPDKVISYVPLISGIVERCYFSLGDKVRQGQALFDIRSADLSALQAELVALEAEVKIARRDLLSVQAMFDDKMMSEKDLLEAQARLKQAEATLIRAENDMSAYTDKGNGTFSVKAPMPGYIVEKNISSGSPVSASADPLFVIADLSNVWINANVYASNLMFVKEGMEVRITTLSYPGEVFSGKIDALAQVFDSEEKVLKARIVMPNSGLKFKPEMAVVIKLNNETHNKLVSIPTDALVFDDNRYFVVVENSPGTFEIREVQLKGHNNKTTYILSGLAEGENVVTRNQLLIYSGLNER